PVPVPTSRTLAPSVTPSSSTRSAAGLAKIGAWVRAYVGATESYDLQSSGSAPRGVPTEEGRIPTLDAPEGGPWLRRRNSGISRDRVSDAWNHRGTAATSSPRPSRRR